jgi:hypothetical protein
VAPNTVKRALTSAGKLALGPTGALTSDDQRGGAKPRWKLLVFAFGIACASTQTTPRTDSRGNVPLVQIQNDSYSEAVVFLDGVRFADVPGGGVILLVLPVARIPADGQLRFAARLNVLAESVQLPVVQYRSGRKVRIILKPQLAASIAQD